MSYVTVEKENAMITKSTRRNPALGLHRSSAKSEIQWDSGFLLRGNNKLRLGLVG